MGVQVTMKSVINKPSCSMQAYSPINGKKYETLSYLPQLTNDDIRKQIEYMIRSNWTPCLEFSDVSESLKEWLYIIGILKLLISDEFYSGWRHLFEHSYGTRLL